MFKEPFDKAVDTYIAHLKDEIDATSVLLDKVSTSFAETCKQIEKIEQLPKGAGVETISRMDMDKYNAMSLEERKYHKSLAMVRGNIEEHKRLMDRFLDDMEKIKAGTMELHMD